MFEIPEDLYPEIHRQSLENQTTPYVVMLKVFCETLEGWAGNEEFIVGTPVPNRDDSLVSDVIGLFSHTLLIRYRKEEAGLKALTDQVASAQRFAAFPVESHYTDQFEESNLIQVRFVLQQALGVPSIPDGWEVCPVPIDRGISKYDVSMVVAIHGTTMRGWFEYNSAVFEATTIESLCELYLENLKSEAQGMKKK